MKVFRLRSCSLPSRARLATDCLLRLLPQASVGITSGSGASIGHHRTSSGVVFQAFRYSAHEVVQLGPFWSPSLIKS
ncbi:hypothetical protein NPIL_489621 [Nephila pilipes]|uniref:Uncharacterized protein n=1 Tax=Nephila pilipes TaxID=299642 RepID=A0A8X6P5J7_NEPPI|nr:hypothetical protein NPIL_489621 [Nephila pilipes]